MITEQDNTAVTSSTAVEITRLVEPHDPPCVSIYLPTVAVGPDAQQNRVRFKNLLREAEKQLSVQGHKAQEWLAPAQALLSDTAFWSHPQEGMAVLLAPQQFKVYRLPFPVEEKMRISQHFHIRPLLWQSQFEGRFYVLALSLRHSQLLECSFGDQQDVELPADVPRGVEEIRAGEVIPDGRAWHGHDARNELERDVKTFIMQLEKAVNGQLNDRSPLVLAGVEDLVAAYRHSNRYEPLLAGAVLGSPEGSRPEQLRERAWEVVAPEFQREREMALERLRELQGQGQRSARDIHEILTFACSGRVEALLLPYFHEVWGHFDRETLTATVTTSESGEELLELAAHYTLQKGGRVFLFEPDALAEAGAILRY